MQRARGRRQKLPDDAEGWEVARQTTQAALDQLARKPALFGQLAKTLSDCPSGAVGGSLGQLGPGDVVGEVEQALAGLEPGQILEVGLMGYGEIPLGLASSPTRRNTFDIVVRAVGRVSQAINRLKVGDTLLVRGPLGKGFDLSKFRGGSVLIIAGGIGLCPTRSLIQYILDRRDEFKRFILFYGARDPKQQLFLKELAEWRDSKVVEYFETVDKGDPSWKGNVGVITTLFPKVKIDPGTKVVVCGPPIMFKFVIAELDKLGIPRENVFVDLERRMKCGVGKCGHCQINGD